MCRLIALLCLILFAWTGSAAAQTTINHCLGANGDPVFTDQPCASLHATRVRPADAGHQPRPPHEPVPILCAANRQALRQGVIDAFANHDANRLAGLMLWNGFGRSAAVQDVRALGKLMQQPLLGLGPTPDQDPAGGTSDPPGLAALGARSVTANTQTSPAPVLDQLIVRTAKHDGESTPALHFDVLHLAGCLWLRRAGGTISAHPE